MKTYLVFTTRVLGLYAAFLAFIHEYFEMQQGNLAVNSISIHAIGNGCLADQTWHACFPAITLWTTFYIAGLATIIISILLFLFILF